MDGNKSLIGASIYFCLVSLFLDDYPSLGLCVTSSVWVFCDDFEKHIKEIAATTFVLFLFTSLRFKVLHI